MGYELTLGWMIIVASGAVALLAFIVQIIVFVRINRRIRDAERQYTLSAASTVLTPVQKSEPGGGMEQSSMREVGPGTEELPVSSPFSESQLPSGNNISRGEVPPKTQETILLDEEGTTLLAEREFGSGEQLEETTLLTESEAAKIGAVRSDEEEGTTLLNVSE